MTDPKDGPQTRVFVVTGTAQDAQVSEVAEPCECGEPWHPHEPHPAPTVAGAEQALESATAAVADLAGLMSGEDVPPAVAIAALYADMIKLMYEGWAIEVGLELEVVAGPGRLPRPERYKLVLRHPCGFTAWLDQEAYLAEVINGPVADHHRTGCTT